MKLHLDSIQNYPIKGFSAQTLAQTTLEVGKTIQGDRQYSFENGDSGFDIYDPKHTSKGKFIVLAKIAKAASLETLYDYDDQYLTIKKDGVVMAEGALDSSSGVRDIEFFINDYFDGDLKGEAKLLTAEDHSFSDVRDKCISIINLNSIRKFEKDTGLSIDPIRFRGNLHIDGDLDAFEELNSLEKTLQIGDAKLKIFKKIVRCPAVDVNPTTAARDTDLNKLLKQHYDHMFMGVYAMVVAGGKISKGDQISIG